VHGYGAYANHDADLVKQIAELGNFDVFAIDQRGFGNSEGLKAIVENNQDIYDDQWLLIFEVLKKFKID
jgi:alpha-beta hydrolase superfamily lysophospholipase